MKINAGTAFRLPALPLLLSKNAPCIFTVRGCILSVSMFVFILSSCNDAAKNGSPADASDNSAVVRDSNTIINKANETVSRDDSENHRPGATEEKILSIRRQYHLINSQQLQTKSFGFECDVRDTIRYFLQQGEIVKVTINWGFIGDGKTVEEYYYSNNKIFFVYKRHTGYGPGGGETIFEQRSYFDADKIIRYQENEAVKKCVSCSLDQNSRGYKALVAYSTRDFKASLCGL